MSAQKSKGQRQLNTSTMEHRQKRTIQLASDYGVQRNAAEATFEKILHDELVVLKKFVLKYQSVSMIHDRSHVNMYIDETAQEAIAREITLSTAKLNNVRGGRGTKASNKAAAYMQSLAQLNSELHHVIFNDERRRIEALTQSNKYQNARALTETTDLSTQLARSKQRVDSLVEETSRLSQANAELTEKNEFLARELMKTVRDQQSVHQNIVELRMQGIDFKSEVNRRCLKVLRSIQTRMGFVPSGVQKQILLLNILKAPGDPAYDDIRTKGYREILAKSSYIIAEELAALVPPETPAEGGKSSVQQTPYEARKLKEDRHDQHELRVELERSAGIHHTGLSSSTDGPDADSTRVYTTRSHSSNIGSAADATDFTYTGSEHDNSSGNSSGSGTSTPRVYNDVNVSMTSIDSGGVSELPEYSNYSQRRNAMVHGMSDSASFGMMLAMDKTLNSADRSGSYGIVSGGHGSSGGSIDDRMNVVEEAAAHVHAQDERLRAIIANMNITRQEVLGGNGNGNGAEENGVTGSGRGAERYKHQFQDDEEEEDEEEEEEEEAIFITYDRMRQQPQHHESTTTTTSASFVATKAAVQTAVAQWTKCTTSAAMDDSCSDSNNSSPSSRSRSSNNASASGSGVSSESEEPNEAWLGRVMSSDQLPDVAARGTGVGVGVGSFRRPSPLVISHGDDSSNSKSNGMSDDIDELLNMSNLSLHSNNSNNHPPPLPQQQQQQQQNSGRDGGTRTCGSNIKSNNAVCNENTTGSTIIRKPAVPRASINNSSRSKGSLTPKQERKLIKSMGKEIAAVVNSNSSSGSGTQHKRVNSSPVPVTSTTAAGSPGIRVTVSKRATASGSSKTTKGSSSGKR